MKTIKNTFKPLHEILNHKTYLISLDYKKKSITYDCSVYSTELAYKFKSLVRDLESIDSSFTKNITISKRSLEGIIESKTHKKEFYDFYKKEIEGKIPFYFYDYNDKEFLYPVNDSVIKEIEDKRKLKDRTKDFKLKTIKTGKIPKIKTPINNGIGLSLIDFVALFENNDIKELKKYFKPDKTAPSFYKAFGVSERIEKTGQASLFIGMALDFGFSKEVLEFLEVYKKLKTVSIFNEIGA